MRLGIDFGTTNSAVAVVGADGRARTLELAPGERVQRTVIHASPDRRVTYGNAAFRAYLEHDLQGRFLRSIKAFLPQDVPRTSVAGRMVSFPELVTAYLRFLVERAEAVLGEPVTEVTVGRPVRFHEDPERDEAAVRRLTAAVEAAGLSDWRLQLEPVAAAHFYEQDLRSDRVVLVGYFGGGTSDFAILRVGPGRSGDRLDDILAVSGVAKAGDVLDGCFLETFLMPFFGLGAGLTPRYGTASEPWSHEIHRQIQRLYYLHLLRSDDLARRLDYVETHLDDPVPVERLRRLVFDDLGYPMAWAIEGTKRALSEVDATTFRFDDFHNERLDIARPVDRATFAAGCAAVLDEYGAAVDEVLRLAGLGPGDVDDVFLTGGTAQLPFVQAVLGDRLGAEKLRSADAFTSVCEGLALS